MLSLSAGWTRKSAVERNSEIQFHNQKKLLVKYKTERIDSTEMYKIVIG